MYLWEGEGAASKNFGKKVGNWCLLRVYVREEERRRGRWKRVVISVLKMFVTVSCVFTWERKQKKVSSLVRVSCAVLSSVSLSWCSFMWRTRGEFVWSDSSSSDYNDVRKKRREGSGPSQARVEEENKIIARKPQARHTLKHLYILFIIQGRFKDTYKPRHVPFTQCFEFRKRGKTIPRAP